MDRRTRKLMTMLYIDTDKLNVSRKEEKIGLASIENSVNASRRKLEDYIKKRKERLITIASNSSDNI